MSISFLRSPYPPHSVRPIDQATRPACGKCPGIDLHTRAFPYAPAPRWQVVLWWLCRLLIRFLRPRAGRERGLVYAAYAALFAAALWAQVSMRQGER